MENRGTILTDGADPGRGPRIEVRHTTIADPRARPLLAGLLDEYVTRYGPGARREMTRFPDEQFTPEHGGAFLLLVEDGTTVAGGGYMRYDESTAELKRIWTHPAHRRRGLARRVLRELEATARARGYRRVFLITGANQPEATALYTADGYVQRYGPDRSPGRIPHYAFDKDLPSVIGPRSAPGAAGPRTPPRAATGADEPTQEGHLAL